jgi:hypothetical protein
MSRGQKQQISVRYVFKRRLERDIWDLGGHILSLGVVSASWGWLIRSTAWRVGRPDFTWSDDYATGTVYTNN